MSATQDRLPVLPEDAVLVHIGPHKTGTTAIQSVLGSSRKVLREHGVFYPGRGKEMHHAAVKALRQFADGWAGDATPPPDPEVWENLAAQVRATSGRAVVSSEFLAQADAVARAKLMKDLGPERVHIVAAARNPAAIAVSTWQQVLRKGYPVTLERWLDRFFRRTEVPERPHGFWAHADAAALVAQWVDLVPRERITVVAIDEADRRLLPATFEQLLGLPDGLLADQQPPQSNRGLTEVEAALLRKVIATLQSKLSWAEYTRLVRGGIIRRLLQLRQPPPDEPKPLLPQWAAEQAAVEAERSIAGLRESGVRIVGNLDALHTIPPSTEHEQEITTVPVDLAAQAVVGVIAVGTRGTWTLDGAARRKPAKKAAAKKTAAKKTAAKKTAAKKTAAKQAAAPAPRGVDDIPARELARLLRQRVRAGLGRRLRRD